MFDLNDAAIFVHVVKAGSFAAAGRKLGVPSNTLSRRIQVLESKLGTRLLIRSTRKLNLTMAGSKFFARCDRGITELEQAGASLIETASEPSGTVRATAPVDFFNQFPMTWMAEFIAHYPKVEVEFLLDDRRIDLVEESIDVAFRGGNIDGATLVARKLTDAVVGLFASPDFVAQHQMPDSVRGLAEMQCITPPSGSGHVVWQLRGPQGVADVTVSGRFRANTAQAQVQAARAGLGIALVPLSLAQPEVESGTLVRVLPNYDKNVGSFYAITPSRYLKVPAVTALVDFIATRLKNLYPDG